MPLGKTGHMGLIYEIVLSFFDSYILYEYINNFFEKKRSITGYVTWGIYFLFPLVTKLNNGVANICIVSLITLITIAAGYECKAIDALIYAIIFNALAMLMEILSGYILLINSGDYNTYFYEGSLLSKIFLSLLILLIKKIFPKKNVYGLTGNSQLGIALIPVGCIFVMNNICMLSFRIYSSSIDWVSIASIIIMVIINIAIFKFYELMSEQLEIKRWSTVYEQQLDLYIKHIHEKERMLARVREQEHDIKQNLFVILDMAREEESDAMISFIENLIYEGEYASSIICDSGNGIIDSMINYKYMTASMKNIKFEVDINIPMELTFRGPDLCIIIGNSLDNAIEAAEKVKKNAIIDFFMKYEKGVLSIVIKNSYDGILKRDKSNRLITVKSDAENHGIGIKTMERAIEKYNGSLLFEQENQFFITKVLLYSLKDVKGDEDTLEKNNDK